MEYSPTLAPPAIGSLSSQNNRFSTWLHPDVICSTKRALCRLWYIIRPQPLDACMCRRTRARHGVRYLYVQPGIMITAQSAFIIQSDMAYWRWHRCVWTSYQVEHHVPQSCLQQRVSPPLNYEGHLIGVLPSEQQKGKDYKPSKTALRQQKAGSCGP